MNYARIQALVTNVKQNGKRQRFKKERSEKTKETESRQKIAQIKPPYSNKAVLCYYAYTWRNTMSL